MRRVVQSSSRPVVEAGERRSSRSGRSRTPRGRGDSTSRRLDDSTTRRQNPASRGVAFAAIIITLAAAPIAMACPVCFGSPDDPMVKGVNNGIWVLLGAVAFVQAGLVAMFWSFWRRARERQRFRDSFHIVNSPDRGGPES